MLELMIGEGKEKFDKLNISGEFEDIAQRIDMIHNQDDPNRVFVFKKNKLDNISRLVDDDVVYDSDCELLVFHNPSFIALDKNMIPKDAIDMVEFFIGINNSGGLKFTAYNSKNINIKEYIKMMNCINGLGSICICNSIFIWVNGRIRLIKFDPSKPIINNKIVI